MPVTHTRLPIPPRRDNYGMWMVTVRLFNVAGDLWGVVYCIRSDVAKDLDFRARIAGRDEMG